MNITARSGPKNLREKHPSVDEEDGHNEIKKTVPDP